MNISQDLQSTLNQYDDCPFLLSELERIDLILQKYYYNHKGSNTNALNTFLLSEEEIEERIQSPTGRPHWMVKEPTITYSLGNKYSSMTNGLIELIHRFELTDFERDALLLGLLPHFNRRYYDLFSLIQGGNQGTLPSFSLALALFCSSTVEEQAQQASFLHQAPLIRCRLLSVENKKNIVWNQSYFIADSSVYYFLLGHYYLPPELSLCAQWSVFSSQSFYPVSLKHAIEKILLTDDIEPRPIVLLRGVKESARAHSVASIFASENRPTLLVDMDRCIERDNNTLLIQLKNMLREIQMRAACIIFRNLGRWLETNIPLLDVLSGLLNQPGLRVVCLIDPDEPHLALKKIPILQLDMPILTLEEKVHLLKTSLPKHCSSDIDPLSLSQRYTFTSETLPFILQEAELYQQQRDPTGKLQHCDIRKALNINAQQNFGQLAQRVTPKRELKDLLVSDNVLQQLHEILIAIKYREKVLVNGFKDKIGYGNGISALFYGDSGTGKTMAAEVLADAIGVDLIKVDLSTVINKYIGETEKNLSRIFDLAEQDAGILFFDEADALFGKRSETKDAQDRHANIEVSYLLQRLENYPGLVILSTNNRSHLDSAFNRRFTFITRFTYPDEALRYKMWRSIWPQKVKISSDVDFRQLAKKASITGANIRNIALLATFFAAENDAQEVSYAHIETALIRELAKIGKVVI